MPLFCHQYKTHIRAGLGLTTLCFESTCMNRAANLTALFVLLMAGTAQASAVGVASATNQQTIIRVQTVDGKSLPNVTVVCIGPRTNAVLTGTTVEGGDTRFSTDEKGCFKMPLICTNTAVVVANDDGFGLAQSRDLLQTPTLTVRSWGCIAGRRVNRGRPVAGQRIAYGVAWRFLISKDLETPLSLRDHETITDSEGRLAFEHVPPVEIVLREMQKHPENAYISLQMAEIKPGETNEIEIATKGRTVIGRLVLEPGLTNRLTLASLDAGLQADMNSKKPSLWPSIPEEFDTAERRARWWRDWYRTDAGRERLYMYSRLYGIELRPDGSFIADLIEPGKYWMTGDVEENGKTIAVLSEHVEIPELGTNVADAPVDLGAVMVRAEVNLKPGDMAPVFSAKTLAGASFKLSDLHGKYVLLHFWATWCHWCVEEIPTLKNIHEEFGKDQRFAMVGLSLDSDCEVAEQFAQARNLAWTQVCLGDWSRASVREQYGVYGIPAIFLIGPDGKVLATNLEGDKIRATVASALAVQ